MTDHGYNMSEEEVKRRYESMSDENVPELWDKIADRLDAAEDKAGNASESGKPGAAADAGKTGRRGPWRTLFGRGTLRTALAVFAICVIAIGILRQSGLFHGLGSGAELYSTSAASASSTAVQEAKSDGAQNAEADEYAAADAGTTAAAAGTADDSAAVKTAGSSAAAKSGDEASLAAAETMASGSEDSSRKLIRSIDISAETREFDSLIGELKEQAGKAGGYIESSSVSGSSYYSGDDSLRSASFTIRIPSGKTDAFLEQMKGECNVIGTSESTQDITLTYVDVKSHIEALEEEKAQLMKLMEKADSTEAVIAVQEQLTQVRYELESYQSQLKTYDNLVDYDTVDLDISEVRDETPAAGSSVWQRMGDGFVRNAKAAAQSVVSFCVWFVADIPYFILLFAVICIVLLLIRRIGRRRKTKNRKNEK